jgi:hypothetical protein
MRELANKLVHDVHVFENVRLHTLGGVSTELSTKKDATRSRLYSLFLTCGSDNCLTVHRQTGFWDPQ